MATSSSPAVDAVIFDIGNVLVFHDNGLLHRRLAEAAGRQVDAVAELVAPQLWDDIHRGDLDGEEIRRQVCAALGIEMGRDEFARLWSSHFAVNEAILPVVEGLIGKVKLVALSNTNVLHAEYLLELLPLLKRFDHLVFSNELRLTKPDPEFYREALRVARVAASRAVFFDDVEEYVEAARGVGILAYKYRSVPDLQSQLARLGLP